MVPKGVQLDRKNISCLICLDLLKHPVTIPCGHSYCMNCIKAHWDEEDWKGIHSCPQCRKTFIPRPDLVKNTTLAGLVKELKKTGLQTSPADHCYAGPGDVACDFCSGRKLKAFKSCLVCLASYCENHLQPHYDSLTFKKHKLVKPTKNLEKNICSCHDNLTKFFCRTDQQSICYHCTKDQHKGHDTVSAAAERAERQKELREHQQKIQQRIQDREKDVKVLQQEVKAINWSAGKTMGDSENIFSKMIHLIHKRSSDMKQQRITTSFYTANPHCEHSESPHSSNIKVWPLRYFEDVTAAVSEVRDKLQDLLTETWTNISKTVAEVNVLLPPPQPKTRGEVLRYSQEITLDPNTAFTCLNSFTFWHNSIRTPVSGPGSPRVGVYLDHRAGILSFCRVSETMSLLLRVQTTFTQNFYAGLGPYYFGDTAELAKWDSFLCLLAMEAVTAHHHGFMD
ncbi:tripartite motif-containing protein 16-like [Pholidichthys leucotaenia]